MKIIIDNDIRIVDFDSTAYEWCCSNLVIDNPDYYKKERLGKYTGDTPKEIMLFTRDGNELRIPFGYLRIIWRMFNKKDLYDYRIKPIEPLEYKSSINLYPYQKSALEGILKAKNGVLVMPCGSGKTVCGIAAISSVGGKALWLTHTQDLLNQSKKRAESVLDVKEGMLGTITAGKVDIGTHITFATVQTMTKLDLAEYKDTWNMIVVDECQHCAGSPAKVTQFYKVVNALSARYKIGLTATPKRADGLEQSIFALLGDIAHTVSRDKVDTCHVKVIKMQTGWEPDLDEICDGDGVVDYNKVVNAMINDDIRFNAVSDIVCSINGSAIVLANRVEYLKRLCKEYNDSQNGIGVCISGAGQSKKAKEERKNALDALNSGKINCIFATYALAKEGLDVPNLRYVVFATPEKDETTVIQSVGRVARTAEGKEYGTVIDFVDYLGIYQGWSKLRDRYYKKIDAEIL